MISLLHPVPGRVIIPLPLTPNKEVQGHDRVEPVRADPRNPDHRPDRSPVGGERAGRADRPAGPGLADRPGAPAGPARGRQPDPVRPAAGRRAVPGGGISQHLTATRTGRSASPYRNAAATSSRSNARLTSSANGNRA